MSKPNPQSGQTLIETITALFILTMALVAGLSLAIYAATQTTNSRDRIIASNLAREGVEAVRMLRDTNWLAAEDLSSTQDFYTTNGGCYYSANVAENRPCYPDAFNLPYDFEDTASARMYRLIRDSSLAGWSLDTSNGQENFLLCLQADGRYLHDVNGGTTCNAPYGKFARRVTVATGNTAYPYTTFRSNPVPDGAPTHFGGHSPEKIITSIVVWQGRGCPPLTDFTDPLTYATTNPDCQVTVTERLTNWKDYR